MSFRDKLEEIDSLQKSIANHGKLGKDLLQKINYKFRLDWNYYSNRMEGNTLTLDETKSVMIGNINVHNKPLKDVIEMKGHDEAIQTILKIGRGELNVSEARIKKLHEEIMYEDAPSAKANIGQWKRQPNHVINYREEKFDFTEPGDVPESMHDLVNWINTQGEKIETKKKDAIHPVELAFEFHLRYLTIHPFYDGNGRTSRILTNLILISFGYPPIYIKDNEKQYYYRYLADVQGYGAEKHLLFELMSDYLIRSLDIVTNAISGKEVEEPEDLDKKIQLLSKELITYDKPINGLRFSKENFFIIYDTWLLSLIASTIEVFKKFRKLFLSNDSFLTVNITTVAIRIDDKAVNTILADFADRIRTNQVLGDSPFDIEVSANYKHLAGVNSNPEEKISLRAALTILFSETKYQIRIPTFDNKSNFLTSSKLQSRPLGEPLKAEEIKNITMEVGNTIFGFINHHAKKSSS